MRAAGAAALLLISIAAAGCGESRIDTARTESEIAKAILDQTGIAVDEVECPKDVELEEGGRFACTARGSNGGHARVEVVQTDGEGNIRFSAPDLTALRPGGRAPESGE